MKDRNSRQYVIELDGVTYRCSGGMLEQVADAKDVQGDKWFVSDMESSVARTMTIEAPAKYAEVMVRKKLQESGEFDEPINIITHCKEKKDDNTTDILFTAVPTRLFRHYFEQIEKHNDTVLLFPLFSVLHGVLRHMRHPMPVAVVFQHGRFADLIIGTKKRIYYANRSMAFDTSEGQISGLWGMVQSDISTAEAENRIQVEEIFFLNWIDSTPEPEWPDDMGKKTFHMEEETLLFEGQEHRISFLKALRMQSACRAISPALEKICYYNQRSLPWLNAAFFFAILLCIGGYFWCGQQTEQLGQELATVQRRVATLHHEAPAREIPYEDTLSFVKELNRYRRAPSYSNVISDISEALSGSMTVEVLKIDYTEGEVKIEIYGKAKASFEDAHKGYQRFTKVLTGKGYAVAESKFDTQIRQSEFLVRFTKRIL